MKKATYSRKRTLRCRPQTNSNKGNCVECGKASAWRSVNQRCWRCEVVSMKSRQPMYIERDVLMMVTNAS